MTIGEALTYLRRHRNETDLRTDAIISHLAQAHEKPEDAAFHFRMALPHLKRALEKAEAVEGVQQLEGVQ